MFSVCKLMTDAWHAEHPVKMDQPIHQYHQSINGSIVYHPRVTATIKEEEEEEEGEEEGEENQVEEDLPLPATQSVKCVLL